MCRSIVHCVATYQRHEGQHASATRFLHSGVQTPSVVMWPQWNSGAFSMPRKKWKIQNSFWANFLKNLPQKIECGLFDKVFEKFWQFLWRKNCVKDLNSLVLIPCGNPDWHLDTGALEDTMEHKNTWSTTQVICEFCSEQSCAMKWTEENQVQRMWIEFCWGVMSVHLFWVQCGMKCAIFIPMKWHINEWAKSTHGEPTWTAVNWVQHPIANFRITRHFQFFVSVNWLGLPEPMMCAPDFQHSLEENDIRAWHQTETDDKCCGWHDQWWQCSGEKKGSLESPKNSLVRFLSNC